MKKVYRLMIISVFSLLVFMLINPVEAFNSAVSGLSLWWEVIVPSLLPFFIGFELLLAMGISNFLRSGLEPLMRPLFALPGASALAVAMGFCSGFPTGAAIAAGLHNNGDISHSEGARLIAFTNNASPLYITIGISAGILGYPQAAAILMPVHYLGNLLIGLLLRFWPGSHRCCYRASLREPTVQLLSPGLLLKNAAFKSAANIMLIGCYMTFFSVLSHMILLIPPLPQLLAQNPQFAALGSGFWEMSLGINALATLPLDQSIPLAAVILAWGGISVQAQVAAMVAGTGIKMNIYYLSRLLHVIISYTVASAICKIINIPLAVSACTQKSFGSLIINRPFFFASLLFCSITFILFSCTYIGKKYQK